MATLPLLAIEIPESALAALGEKTGQAAGQAAEKALEFAGSPTLLVGGVVLVIAAILVFFFLKKIIVNTVLGIVGWAIVTYVIGIELPFLPSLAVSVIFGLAGIGAMLVLRFFGVL